MELLKLEVSKRDAIGSNAVRALRKQGMVPAVVYGHNQESIPVVANERDLGTVLDHHAQFVELSIGGQAVETAIIRDVQYDTWGQVVRHVDFVRIDAAAKVEVTLPVVLFGQPVGLKDGGLLKSFITTVKVLASPRDIPENVVVPVKGLALHDSVLVKDLPFSDQVEVLADADGVVCTVVSARAEAAAAEAAEAEEGDEPDAS